MMMILRTIRSRPVAGSTDPIARPRRYGRALVALPMLVAVLSLAGCGGGEAVPERAGSPSAPSPAGTRASESRPPAPPATVEATAPASATAVAGPAAQLPAGPVETTGVPRDTLPGAAPHPDALRDRIEAKWTARPAGYVPRTRHLRPDGSPRYTNRLYLETSPYLLQHAHNPVNWFPWGDEAFEEARRRGVPVLLSVGYSTCHWCHVMEEESFEDEEIARVMNERYVAIKVDREERTDVDGIYMTAVQMLTGRGGWPMTVWLTHERKPYYGGTYFPPRDGDRGSSIGFLTLLQRLATAFAEQHDRIGQASEEVVAAVRQHLLSAAPPTGVPGVPVLHQAASVYRSAFDPRDGGVSGAPKFPSSLPVRFLLRYHRRTQDRQALEMATLTLEKMAAGGMYDHVGGGFHRYSTDARWLVPHFEKMLYDNALLVVSYLEAYQVTGREDFRRVAEEILRYVDRDMTSPEGAFYSAEDADSPTPDGRREEGWSYTWTPQELEAVLGPERARPVIAFYGVTPGGNFEGRNILNVTRSLQEVAAQLSMKPEDLASSLQEAKELLYAAREKRPPPIRDEKVLAGWNGLMVSALARAGLVLGEKQYVERAERAAGFILGAMRRNGRLMRSFMDGQTLYPGYLEDYAFAIAGLLDLFETTGRVRWLHEAISLDGVLQAQFEDKDRGGFFQTSHDHEALIARERPSHDGAVPSGNSVHALNLLRLRELTLEDGYRKRAEGVLRAFSGGLEGGATSLSEMLLALDFYLDTPKEIVVVAKAGLEEAEPLLGRLRKVFLPNRVIVLGVEGPALEEMSAIVPLAQQKVPLKGRATAYVCEDMVCDLPTSDPEVFGRQLATVEKLPAAPAAPAPAGSGSSR